MTLSHSPMEPIMPPVRNKPPSLHGSTPYQRPTTTSAQQLMVGDLFEQAHKQLTTRLQKCSRKNVVTEDNVYNLVADLDAKDIRDVSRNAPGVLTQYLKDPKAYTSCIDAAPRVYKLITDKTCQETSSKGKCDVLAKEIGKLGQDANVAINAKFGAEHGFVIVVRGNETEILQSFAGNDGAALTESFSNGSERKVFDRPTLMGLLTAADSNDVKTAQGAQQNLFGGTVGANGTPGEGNWDSRNLISDSAIRKNMTDKLDAGLKALKS
jgi:hypothetical protein